jgi:putative sigma-54 modulation protein
MNIIIQSLGFKASAGLEASITEKLNGLKSHKISNATVTLYKGPDGEPYDNYCEIRLNVPGNDPFVKRHDARFETAVSHCVDALKNVLQQQKEKHIRERQGNAAVIQDVINEAETDQDPELEDVVK